MLNHITIMGRVTRDPELRRTGNGTAVANFTLAVDRDYSPKDGGEKETDFIDCVAWRQTGEFISRNFAKGRMMVVSGKLRIRKWTDKDGASRRSAEIEVESAYFGDSKKSEGGNVYTPAQNTAPAAAGGFSETTALLGQYGYNADVPASDFAMLEDDGEELPF